VVSPKVTNGVQRERGGLQRGNWVTKDEEISVIEPVRGV